MPQPKEHSVTASHRHPHVVNVEEIVPEEQTQGGFGFRRRRLGPDAGSRAIGCSQLEVAPGKTAFPFHFHSAFEEAIYVLEGTGTLRIGTDQVELRAGDYVALPPGPEAPHALTNTGPVTLGYLCLSAPAVPMTLDVVVYPDSKKIAFASGVDPVKGFRGGTWAMKIVKEDQPSIGYYDGEPLARQ
jgi:uncharacterized cupin superfamily protein